MNINEAICKVTNHLNSAYLSEEISGLEYITHISRIMWEYEANDDKSIVITWLQQNYVEAFKS